MDQWTILLEITILLGAALVLGTVAEHFRQSAILGYLLAGTIVGPNVLGWVTAAEHVALIAELGVALLLFTIGLEFSFERLKRLRRIALVGGTLQVGITGAIAGGLAAGFGVDWRASVCIGAMVALSSTAGVLRLLVDRSVIDSVHGRNALGILLLQDLAVIPLMLLVVILSVGGTLGEAAMAVGGIALKAIGLIAGFVVVFILVVPRILNLHRWARNRELPILFAICLALGSAIAAHAAQLSPAIGAFIAGVLLGESPFATQIRADVASFKTVLVTFFFASIGMVGDPAWMAANLPLVLGAVVLVVGLKASVVFGVVRLLGHPAGVAAATAVCLAQIGEFSFVLANVARGADPPLIDDQIFNVVVSTTIATLFLTPMMIAGAPWVAGVVERLTGARRGAAPPGRADSTRDGEDTAEDAADDAARQDIFIIGFGPAGLAVAEALYEPHRGRIRVIDMSRRSVDAAKRAGLDVMTGDARHHEVLEHAGVGRAVAIAITLPDATSNRAIIDVCRSLAPNARLVVRSRYHVHRWELSLAGAHEVVDEEEQVGARMADVMRRELEPS